MKKISLIIIFFLLSSFVFASDWRSTSHDSLNTGFVSHSISTSNFISTLNLTIQSGDYVPVSYDFTGDGFAEIIVYDSNLLNVYSGNGYSLISQVNGYNLISDPFIFAVSSSDPLKRIIGFNATHVLFWNVDSSGIISFSNSVSFPVVYVDQSGTYANYYPKSSVNCYSAFNQSKCIFKANASDYVLFNFSSSDFSNSVTLNNYSYSKFYTGNNFKPALYPTTGLDYYGTFICTQSSRYGVALINLTDGSIYNENCTISGEAPTSNPSIFSTSGSVYDIFWTGDAGANKYIHRANTLLVEKTNYPITISSAGLMAPFGISYNGNRLYECLSNSVNSFWIKAWDLTTASPTLKISINFGHNVGGGNAANGLAAFSGSDYFYCSNTIYSEATNSTQTLDKLGTTSSCYHAMYSGNNVIQSCNDNTIKIYDLGAAPLTYPNVTLAFRNNVSNNTLGAIEFFIFDINGNPEFYGQTNQDGTIFLGSQISTGLHNVTSSVNGFLPIAQIINVTNGTDTKYIYGQPNSSLASSINLQIFDSKTGLPITGIKINATLVSINSSGQKINSTQTNSLGNYSFSVNAGNYSIILNDPSFAYQTAVVPNFYHAGTDNIEQSMTAVVFISQSAPRVFSLTSFVYVDLLNNGNFQSSVKLYDYGNACVDEVIWFNATTTKNDVESYSLFDRCGNENNGTWNPLLILDSFAPYKIINNYFLCEYNETGTYEVDAYAVSPSFSFNSSEFDILVSQGKAQKLTINVVNCSNIANHTRIQDNTANNENSGSFGQIIYRFFAGLDPLTNLMIFFFVWLFVAGPIGYSLATSTNNPQAYLYVFGVVGFFDVSFFTWIFPLLGGFILFSVILIIIVILTIRAKNRTIGDGGGN